ncbi:lysoplasmalogenase [Maribacter litopenaei]|uniref:lysoplasmalogenase n=1 Tax=Maribacter litopenaei TaxID=2976127 RepID=UPI003B84870E
MAHICYILLFSKDLASSINWYKITIVIAVFVYAMLLFNYLSPHLNDMMIPVILYILAIIAMVTMAVLCNDNLDKAYYNKVLIGALLFMGSDSILAVDKFVNPLPYASIIIMTSYAAAQYFIVTGVIKRALH